MNDQTKDYEAPQIADYGELSELTAAATTGSHLDADFSTGTPVTDLTFS